MSVTLPINLNTNLVSQREVNQKLVTLDTREQDPSNNGLFLVSGNTVADGLGYTPFASAGATIKKIEGYDPATLTSALFGNLHLVKGEVITIESQYDFKDDSNNDFAFALIAQVGRTANAQLIADGNSYNKNGGGITYVTTFNINESGEYNLLLASADAGDTKQHSNLIVHSIGYTIPDTGPDAYTVTPDGLRLLDGSQILANGAGLLPNGVPISNLLAAGGQFSNAYIVSHDASGIVSHDASGIVSHDASGIVSHDASGLISQDGGTIVSHDASGLISQDGGGLISQDGGTIVSHDASGLISQDGGGLISQDGGGLISQDGGSIVSHDASGIVATGGGNITLRTLLYKGPSDIASLAESRPLTTTPSITLQTATVIGQDRLVGETAPAGAVQGDPRIAALSTGGFAVVWADTLSGHFEIRAQLRNADGTTVAPSFVVSTETASDQSNPSVTGLSGGRFVVSWQGHSIDGSGNKSAPDIHTQILGSDGAKIGAEQRVGSTSLEETGARVVSTTNGGYALLLQAATPGIDGNTGLGQFYDSNGALITSFGFGSTDAGTLKLAAAGAGLADGGLAIAYGEHNTTLSDQDGLYLDIVSSAGAVTHSEVHVNSTTPGVQGTPAIARLANGNVVVAWIDGGPGNGADISTLRAQILDPTGTKVGGEIRIADTLKGGDAPAITALADGRFDVTWDGPVTKDGAVVGLNLRSQIFSADGTTASPVFDVTTPSVDNAYRVGAPVEVQLTNGTLAVVGQVTVGTTSTIHTDLFSVGVPAVDPPTVNPIAPVTLTKVSTGASGVFFPGTVVAGDLNGDGKVDLVVGGQYEVRVLLGRGDGTFDAQSPITPAQQAGSVALADVNGDGKLDIVIGGPSSIGNYHAASTLLGRGDGTFAAPVQTPFGFNQFNYGITVADVTGDGKADVLAARSGYSIAAGNGDGTFQPPVDSATNTYLSDVVTGDFNGDGKLDIVTTQPGTYLVTVTNSTGAGSFASPIAIDVGPSPEHAVVADVDGDGKLDIVVARNNGNVGTDDDIVILLGQGNGTFKPQIATALGRATQAIAVGDLNGDGHADVVTANAGYDSNFNYTATVLLGRGDGTFVKGATLVTGSGPDSVALADFDGDGKLDVAFSNHDSETLSVFLNATVIAPSTALAPGAVAPTVPATSSTVPAGGNAVSYTDAFGHTVTDTTDSGGRLIKEVVADATSGAVLSTVTLTYKADGTYDQHSELVTTTGSVTVDAAYGPKGELSEVLRDQQGQVTGTATVTYNADGTVGRHTTSAGQSGFDDFVYSTAIGSANGGFVSHTHTDATGTVTTIDVNGNVVAAPPVVTPTADTTPPPLSVAAPVLAVDTGSSASDNITANGAVTVTGTTAAVAGTSVHLFDGAADLGAASLAGGAFSFATTLTEGVHTLHAVATDLAGNATASSSFPTITVDRTAPAAPSLALAHDTGLSGSDHVTNDARLAVGSVEGGAILAYTVDGAAAPGYTPASLGQGLHSVSVVQSDAAGNVSAVASLGFTLDTVAPTAQPDSAKGSGIAAALTGNVLTNDGDASAIHVTGAQFASSLLHAVPDGDATQISGNAGILTVSADGRYSYQPAAPGQDSFTYGIADAAGNVGHSTVSFDVARAGIPASQSFGFALTEAHFDFSHGHALMTAPDGTVTDLTGVATLTFADGAIQERDGSPLVDDLFYDATYLDVWRAHIDPDQHYAQYGWHEGRNPSAVFSTSGYLAANPDVAAAGIDPLTHYDQHGWHEGRSPGAAFSAEAYLAAHSDVAAAGIDPLAHYLDHGQAEGSFAFHGLTTAQGGGDHLYGAFDATYYLAHNADVAAAIPQGRSADAFAFAHYLTYGAQEGRDPDAYFSTAGYLAANPDVAAAGLNPLLHYEQYGWHEGRDPSAALHTNAYLAANPDVAAAVIEPLQHYLQYGIGEGRHVS